MIALRCARPSLAAAGGGTGRATAAEPVRFGEVGGRALPIARQRLIGRVGVDDLAARAEQHDGIGQSADDLFDIIAAARQLVARLEQRRPDAERNARAERPAERPHLPAVAGGEQQIEALAAGAQIRDALRHRLGICRHQPRGEIEYALDAPSGGEDRGRGSEEPRRGAARPHDGDLAGARQQRLVVVDKGTQRRDLLGRAPPRVLALAHDAPQDRGREQREGAGAQRDRQRDHRHHR